jgi:hypothetical protein
MFYMVTFLWAVFTTALHGAPQGSPPQTPSPSTSIPAQGNQDMNDAEWEPDDTGEVDEDIIIEDDDDSNDDEGVTS